MKNSFTQLGFTLIELLVTIAIVGVLAGYAYPAYIGYIDAGCLSTARNNAKTLRVFEENYLVENNTYFAGTHNAGDATSTLKTVLHWNPDDDDRYTYKVEAGATGLTNSAKITVSADNCSIDIVDDF